MYGGHSYLKIYWKSLDADLHKVVFAESWGILGDPGAFIFKP